MTSLGFNQIVISIIDVSRFLSSVFEIANYSNFPQRDMKFREDREFNGFVKRKINQNLENFTKFC